MSKELELNYSFTKDSVLKASKLYYDYDMRNSAKRYVGWFFVALVQFGIVGALKHDSFGLLYLSTFLVAYWYYGRWYLRSKMIERFYNKKGVSNSTEHFIVKDDGLHYLDRVISWDEIVKIIPFDDGILMQTLEHALFFNNDSFKSVRDRELFIKWAKEKGKL